jgi:hypothetical protein
MWRMRRDPVGVAKTGLRLLSGKKPPQ